LIPSLRRTDTHGDRFRDEDIERVIETLREQLTPHQQQQEGGMMVDDDMEEE
jgi:hypothetical protein